MINFTQSKKQWLAALIFCLILAVPGCAQSGPNDVPDNPHFSKSIEQANDRGTSRAPDGRAPLAAPSANAFRCYILNQCRGRYIPGVATVKACVELGGNSWTNNNGICVPDIGE